MPYGFNTRDYQAVSLIHSFKRKAVFGGRRAREFTPQADELVVRQREVRTVKRSFHISRQGKSTLECKPVHGQLRTVSGAWHWSQLFGLCLYSVLLDTCFAITLDRWDRKGHVTHSDYKQAGSFVFSHLCSGQWTLDLATLLDRALEFYRTFMSSEIIQLKSHPKGRQTRTKATVTGGWQCCVRESARCCRGWWGATCRSTGDQGAISSPRGSDRIEKITQWK